MSRPVPRIGRILDAVGLLVFVAGAGVYGWAWRGLRRLRETQPAQPISERFETLEFSFTAVVRWNRLRELSWLGASLMAIGVAVAVAAAVIARRRRSDEE